MQNETSLLGSDKQVRKRTPAENFLAQVSGKENVACGRFFSQNANLKLFHRHSQKAKFSWTREPVRCVSVRRLALLSFSEDLGIQNPFFPVARTDVQCSREIVIWREIASRQRRCRRGLAAQPSPWVVT